MESLLAGRALAKHFDIPLVAEMRDAWPDLVAHTPGLGSPGSLTSALKRRVHTFVTRMQRRADAVVTTTDTFASVLRARGIERVTVIRNGTDARRYRSIEVADSRSESALRALYIGTIGRSQGLESVIAAAARLRALSIPIEVRLVGQGADVGRLRRMNQRLGSPVSIVGQVDGSQVIDHYRWADTTIVSLRDWEPFSWTVPSKLYELLAAGKHVTGLIAGEAAAILSEAGAGDLVAPGDVGGLVALWTDLQRDRSKLLIGSGGRAWVEEHASYDHIAQAYLQLLDSVSSRFGASKRA